MTGLGDNKAFLYLEAVNVWGLSLVLLAAATFLVLLPARLRVQAGVFLSAAWLPMNLFTDFLQLFVPAKVTFFAGPGLILLGLATTASHVFQRGLVWVLPLFGLAMSVFVLRTADVSYALVTRLGWSFGALAFSGLAVYTVDTGRYRETLGAFTYGAVLPIGLAAAALVFSPGSGFGRGVGRFFPWGANPNQIGPLFASTGVLALTLMLVENRAGRRGLLAAILVACTGLTLMTGSRSALLILAGPAMLIAAGYRRFVWLAVIGLAGLTAWWLVVYRSGVNVDLARITGGGDSGRLDIARIYFRRLIGERPMLGLLEAGGLNSQQESGVGTHSHNVYVEFLYLGGLPLLLAATGLLVGMAIVSVRMVLAGIATRHSLLLGLGAIPLVMLVHNLTTIIVIYPTNSWYAVVIFSAVALGRLSQYRREGHAAPPAVAPGVAAPAPGVAV
ncbi:hypothetical protein [Phycisphaera mikurensis]|uniref:O-antigen polymerase family protein n=1 Tax=Phycisphaera mikurensis (strain NBRC 102666 / KCTC 22515 / FYK2301M01) TaxID=1142394 RepID=I0IAD7_PHYMF|nr:hypothetical protein [Phycisphaera mikurensis]MBB6441779.1 hypothetical protein [Phycisphaera mikurensis]BAM02225.1 hypothetical protein PSMK_00660 [Phycisphaera mikurensis NBRC 102666]